MRSEADIMDCVDTMLSNLDGWAEPHGPLIPTEPDPCERALIRIRLRAIVRGLRLVLDKEPTDRLFDAEDHRDRMRIYDSGLSDGSRERVNVRERGLSLR